MNQPMQLPAYLTANRPGRSLVGAAASGLGAARPAHISRRGNRFTLVDAAGNTKPVALMDQTGNVYIDVVILDANENPSRLYFDKGYDDNNPDPPACWSDNGVGPSSQAAKPQSPTCSACPQSAWGSAVSKLTGAPIPACQSSKKLAVLVVGDDSEIIYEFLVPPGSFSDKESGWRRYVNTIGAHGVDLCDVVTRISFVPNSMGVLAFQPTALLNEAQAEARAAAWATKTTDQVVGRLDKPRDPNLPLAARPVAQEARPAGQGQLPPPPANPTPAFGAATPAPSGLSAQPAPEAQPRRQRRTKAEMEAARAAQGSQPAQGNGSGDLDIPPFLQRQPATPAGLSGGQPIPGTQPPPGFGSDRNVGVPAQQFGLQQPQAPDAGLQDALAKAFNLPTGIT